MYVSLIKKKKTITLSFLSENDKKYSIEISCTSKMF